MENTVIKKAHSGGRAGLRGWDCGEPLPSFLLTQELLVIKHAKEPLQSNAAVRISFFRSQWARCPPTFLPTIRFQWLW